MFIPMKEHIQCILFYKFHKDVNASGRDARPRPMTLQILPSLSYLDMIFNVNFLTFIPYNSWLMNILFVYMLKYKRFAQFPSDHCSYPPIFILCQLLFYIDSYDLLSTLGYISLESLLPKANVQNFKGWKPKKKNKRPRYIFFLKMLVYLLSP